MNKWPLLTVEEVAAQSKSALATGPFGSSIGSKTFRDVGVPVIRGSNLSENVGVRLREQDLVFIDEELARKFHRSAARRGDLIFTCWGTINQVGLVDDRCRFQEFIVSNKQMKLTPDPNKAIPLYLYYYFSSPEGQRQIAMNAIGSSVPGFNLTKLRSIKIPVPPLAEQERIVEALASLDDKIELNRRTNETLEAMVQAIFCDWFVEFGPTRRKMKGVTDPVEIMGRLAALPDHASQLASLFPSHIANNGLPDGWQERKLSSFGKIVTGKTPSTKETAYFGADVPFLKIPDMHGRMYVIETQSMLSAAGAASQKKQTVPKGSISVSCIATPGLVVLNHQEVQTNQQINTIIPLKENWSRALFWACRRLSSEVMRGGSGGSVFYNMNKSTFGDLKVVSPANDEIAEAFDELVAPLHDLILANCFQQQTLASTRDLLLPKIISGEIQLNEAEATAEAAE